MGPFPTGPCRHVRQCQRDLIEVVGLRRQDLSSVPPAKAKRVMSLLQTRAHPDIPAF